MTTLYVLKQRVEEEEEEDHLKIKMKIALWHITENKCM